MAPSLLEGVSTQVYRRMTERGATFGYACNLERHRKEVAVELLRGESRLHQVHDLGPLHPIRLLRKFLRWSVRLPSLHPALLSTLELTITVTRRESSMLSYMGWMRVPVVHRNQLVLRTISRRLFQLYHV